MPPVRTPKPPSFMAELFEFSKNVANVPYEELPAVYAAVPWLTRLIEKSVTPMPDATVLVTFDVMIGHAIDEMEFFDTITMRMPQGPGPISMAARMAAVQTLVHLISGRSPKLQAPVQPEHMNGAPERVDVPDRDVVMGENLPPLDAEAPELNIVASYEPDGLPILRDLYEIGEPEVATTREIVDAVLDLVESFAKEATSIEQLAALASKNPDLITFVKDFGTADDATLLRGFIEERRQALLRPAAVSTPRRRSAAAPSH